jgi:hypothetical protein
MKSNKLSRLSIAVIGSSTNGSSNANKEGISHTDSGDVAGRRFKKPRSNISVSHIVSPHSTPVTIFTSQGSSNTQNLDLLSEAISSAASEAVSVVTSSLQQLQYPTLNNLIPQPSKSGQSGSSSSLEANIQGNEEELDQPSTHVPDNVEISAEKERLELISKAFLNLEDCLGAVNGFVVRWGYLKLHQKTIKRNLKHDTAYYECPCSKKGCAKLIMHINEDSCTISKFSSHLCEAVEYISSAYGNTFIPTRVKNVLVDCFENRDGPSRAFELSARFAHKENIATTWSTRDVTNFFRSLQKLNSDNVLAVLDLLREKGHFVEIDVQPNTRILRRFFLSLKSHKTIYDLWGWQALSIDSTYAKNRYALPLLLFGIASSQNKLLLCAVSLLQNETEEDFRWIFDCFLKCMGNLPRVIISDGDRAISAALEHYGVRHLLCRWHISENVLGQLPKKGVPVPDAFEMKKNFFKFCRSHTLQELDRNWEQFLNKYGTTSLATRYLTDEIYSKRHQFVSAYTNQQFHLISTTNVSESLHSLLSHDRCGDNSVAELLVEIDKISLMQSQLHNDRCSMQELDVRDHFTRGYSFVLGSVSPILSDHACSLLSEIEQNSCFVSVEQKTLDSWVVSDRIEGEEYLVTSSSSSSSVSYLGTSSQAVQTSSQQDNVVTRINALYSKRQNNPDICACCRSLEAAWSFRLPKRWQMLYSNAATKRRLLIALGIYLPATSKISIIDYALEHYDNEVERLTSSHSLDEALEEARTSLQALMINGTQVKRSLLKYEMIKCAGPCSQCFHLHCFGLQGPDFANSAPCLVCIQDPKYKPRATGNERVFFLPDGTPRVTSVTQDPQIPKLLLDCQCMDTIGLGLPCLHAVAVARQQGAVLDFRMYNIHHTNNKINGFIQYQPVFSVNKKYVLNTSAILDNDKYVSLPSTLDERVNLPSPVTVVGTKNSENTAVQLPRDKRRRFHRRHKPRTLAKPNAS